MIAIFSMAVGVSVNRLGKNTQAETTAGRNTLPTHPAYVNTRHTSPPLPPPSPRAPSRSTLVAHSSLIPVQPSPLVGWVSLGRLLTRNGPLAT